jgi:uncharacterized protein (DUF849 family)
MKKISLCVLCASSEAGGEEKKRGRNNMSSDNKVVVTCALTGVLTDPAKFNVPVTPEEMADAAAQAHDAGAALLHCHFRDQGEGLGAFPTWDIKSVGDILAAIKDRIPDILICMSTGVMGDDISGPVGCLETFKPELAACNAGSLNYLKVRKDGNWAWPPSLFDNPRHFSTTRLRKSKDFWMS